MALFGRWKKTTACSGGTRPTVGRKAYCRICQADQMFSNCWMRISPLTRCLCCGYEFPEPGKLYQRNLPACAQCGEYLEQPGFEYGICDNCGSKYEVTSGTKPGLLPNKKQRDEMSKHGKAWSPD